MYRILVAFIGVLICCQSFASKEQTDAYIAALSHPYKEVSYLAASDIYYIPLSSDPRLYEYIAVEIHRLHRAVGLTSEDKDKYALLAKALAASSDPQYDDLLQE